MSRDPSPVPALPPPWDTFLAEVDARLSQPVEIHCLGGFVLHVMFGLPRPTADIYDTRLIGIAPGILSKLRLRALSPEDLVHRLRNRTSLSA